MIINQKTKLGLIDEINDKFPKAVHAEQKNMKLTMLEDLEATQNKYQGKMIRATLYQLSRIKKGDIAIFSPEDKKVLRRNCLIEVSEYVRSNWTCLEGGRMYVLDEEATDKNIIEHEEWMKGKQEQEEAEKTVGKNVADAIKGMGAAAKGKTGKK